MEKGKVKLGLSGLASYIVSYLRPGWKEIFSRLPVQIGAISVLDFTAAAILSRACFLGRFSPLGTAYAAACLCGKPLKRFRKKGFIELLPVLSGFAGAVLGGCMMGKGEPLRYISACSILAAAGLIFRGTEIYSRQWFLPCITAFSVLSTGTAFILSAGGITAADFCLMFCESLLCVICTMLYNVFRQGIPPWSTSLTTVHTVSGTLGGWTLEDNRQILTFRQRAAILGAFSSFCAVLFSFSPIFGIRPGNLLALLGVLSASCSGALPGATCGLIFGCALDLSQLSAPLYASLYGFCGLFSGIYHRRTSFLTALSFTAVNAITLVWHPEPKSALLEGFIAGTIFLLFSARFASVSKALFPSDILYAPLVPTGFDAIGYLKSKVTELTGAFSTLCRFCTPSSVQSRSSDVFDIQAESDSKINMSVFNTAIERTCRSCTIRDICWEQEYSSTRQAMTDASSAVLQRGRACAEDFPPHFSIRCIHLSDFLGNLNEATAAVSYRKRFHRRVREDNRLLCAQYDGMTRILGELMDEFRSFPEQDMSLSEKLSHRIKALGLNASAAVYREPSGRYSVRIPSCDRLSQYTSAIVSHASELLSCRMVIASSPEGLREGIQPLLLHEQEGLRAIVGAGIRPKEGEVRCGDSGICFKTPNGKLYLLISDGMGAGDFAERQSNSLAKLLESFLRSGISPQTALRLVCPAFALRSDGEAFASVDLLCIDLYSGNAEFYKCGAAPSYVLSPASPLRRITSAALPAGLFVPGTAEAECTSMELHPGDTVVLVSDGVVSGGDDADFVRILSRTFSSDTDANVAATALLDASAQNCDDATVLVLKLFAR